MIKFSEFITDTMIESAKKNGVFAPAEPYKICEAELSFWHNLDDSVDYINIMPADNTIHAITIPKGKSFVLNKIKAELNIYEELLNDKTNFKYTNSTLFKFLSDNNIIKYEEISPIGADKIIFVKDIDKEELDFLYNRLSLPCLLNLYDSSTLNITNHTTNNTSHISEGASNINIAQGENNTITNDNKISINIEFDIEGLLNVLKSNNELVKNITSEDFSNSSINDLGIKDKIINAMYMIFRKSADITSNVMIQHLVLEIIKKISS